MPQLFQQQRFRDFHSAHVIATATAKDHNSCPKLLQHDSIQFMAIQSNPCDARKPQNTHSEHSLICFHYSKRKDFYQKSNLLSLSIVNLPNNVFTIIILITFLEILHRKLTASVRISCLLSSLRDTPFGPLALHSTLLKCISHKRN